MKPSEMSAHSQALINITEDGASVDDDLTDNNEEEAVSSARQHATYIPLDPNDASSRGYCSICGPDKDNVEVVRKFSSVTPTKGELKKRRDRIFKTRQSFNQHRRQMHGTKAQKDTKLICPADNCKQECSSYNALIEHLNVTHRILCYSESRRFANIQKFDAWIQQLEFDSKCSFVSDGGIHHDKYTTRKYKRCSRSGFYERAAPGTAKSRSIGTRKIQAHCPAYIRLKIDRQTGVVLAEMCLTHVGHDLDIAYLDLPALLIADIQALIKAGESTSAIVEKIKKQCTKQDRGFYLTKAQVEYYRRKLSTDQTEAEEQPIENVVDSATVEESSRAVASIAHNHPVEVEDAPSLSDDQLDPSTHLQVPQVEDDATEVVVIGEDPEVAATDECTELWKTVLDEGAKLVESLQSLMMLGRIEYFKHSESAEDVLAFFQAMSKQLVVIKNRCNAREHPVRQPPQQQEHARKRRKKDFMEQQITHAAPSSNNTNGGDKRRNIASTQSPVKQSATVKVRYLKTTQQEHAVPNVNISLFGTNSSLGQVDEQEDTRQLNPQIQPNLKRKLHLLPPSTPSSSSLPSALPLHCPRTKPPCLKAVYIYRSREQQPLIAKSTQGLQGSTLPSLALVKSPSRPSPMLASANRFSLPPQNHSAGHSRTTARPMRNYHHRLELRQPRNY